MSPLYTLSVEAPEELGDGLSGVLFEAGAEGIEERESTLGCLLVVYSSDLALLERLRRAIDDFLARQPEELAAEAIVEQGRLEDESWQTEWMRHLKQEQLTPSFVIQPLNDTSAPPAGSKLIVFEPTLSFGVGSHATTRLAAVSVERHCRAHPGCSVLDVGTGTGVLAIVAALCGAKHVLGIDVDDVAVTSARRNAELNAVNGQCRFSSQKLAQVAESYELVVANLDVPTIAALAADLVRVTKPGGRLCLTGVLGEFAVAVAQQFLDLGMQLSTHDRDREWSLLELLRPPG